MPRPAKPWWDAAKEQWACRHEGRYTPLGRGTREQATKAFHRLKAEASPKNDGAAEIINVVDVFESYLRFVRANKSKTTYNNYATALMGFDGWLGDLRVDEFTPARLQQWLDDQPKRFTYTDKHGDEKERLVHWTETTKRGKAMTVQQAFRWCRRMRLIPDDPLVDFVKPAKRRREGILSDEQWKVLIGRYDDADPFLQLLQFCRLTGCRPQEVRAIEKRHVAKDGKSVRFPTLDSKGKRRQRVIVLPDEAAAIIQGLAKQTAKGPIFLNEKNIPWTKDSIRQRMNRANKQLKLKRLNLGMVRKTWETNALTKIPLAIVAELAGHDPATALAHYSHLAEKSEALKKAANDAVA